MPPPGRGTIRAGLALFTAFASGLFVAQGFGF